MIPGPFAICRIEFEDDSDSAILHTLRWGYDSTSQAFKDLKNVGIDSRVEPEDCVVIRYVEREEAELFNE
jgi:hypothetical protein